MNSALKYTLLVVFLAVLVITGFLGWQYFQASRGKSISQIPDISIYIPYVGDVILYTNQKKLDSYRVDGLRTQQSDLSYRYKEGPTGIQIIYGTFVRYENEVLSANPKGNSYNYQFIVSQDYDITCWPNSYAGPDGNQIDLTNIWFDAKTAIIPLHLEGESTKKWKEVYTNLEGGESVVIVLDHQYDFNSENKPSQIAVIGCN